MLSLGWKYLFKNSQFHVCLALSVLLSVLALAPALLESEVVNALISGNAAVDALFGLCVGIAAIECASALLAYAANMVYIDLQAKSAFQLNLDVVEHIKRLPQSFFVNFDASYYAQQTNHDANDLVIFLISVSAQLICNVVTLCAALWVLFALNGKVALACLLLAFVGALLYGLFRQRLFKRNYDAQEETSRYFSCLQGQLAHVGFEKRHALGSLFKRQLKRAFQSLFPLLKNNQSVSSAFESANAALNGIAHGCLLAVGVYEVHEGNLMAGYLVTMLSYYSAANLALQFFMTLGKDYQVNKVCYERLHKLLAYEEEHNGAERLDKAGTLVCRGVSMVYPMSERAVVNAFDAQMERGKLYGLAGANGSGKSTLLNVLAGMYPDDYVGSIAYDGADLRDLDLYDFRHCFIGFAEQEPLLIDGSLRDNLAMGSKDFDVEDAIGLMNKLGLHKRLSSSCTAVAASANEGEEHQGFSGGEKQKVALIRLFLKDAPVMLLDEPSSALDAESKAVLVNLLQQKKGDHIILVATHDDALLAACDEVFHL